MEEFVTIEENVDYTLTEKKSKFIANLIRVNSKDEAENEIKKLKKITMMQDTIALHIG